MSCYWYLGQKIVSVSKYKFLMIKISIIVKYFYCFNVHYITQTDLSFIQNQFKVKNTILGVQLFCPLFVGNQTSFFANYIQCWFLLYLWWVLKEFLSIYFYSNIIRQRRKEGDIKLRTSRAVPNKSLFLRTKLSINLVFLNQWVVDDCFMGLINQIFDTNLKNQT
jgi:hypothetical protein